MTKAEEKEASYQFARAELRRIMDMMGSSKAKVAASMSRSVTAIIRDAIEDAGVPKGSVTIAVADYAMRLRYEVREFRGDGTRHRTAMSTIEQHINRSTLLAEKALHSTIKAKHIWATVRVSTAYGGAERTTTRWRISLGPNWKRRVFDRGISLADTTTDPVFVMQAAPKQSSFLAEDGIAVYDAEVYRSSVSGGAHTGFVFRSAGPTGGSDFVVFHEDFMRGATLIKRRIARGVLEALLGEEVQSN